MSSETTIILADDHPIFRQGLKQVIEKHPGFNVIAEADNGTSALELIKQLRPTVAVLDLDMPELDGFAVARRVREAHVATNVIMLTMHKDELHINEAIDLGVLGYVIKDSAASEVVECIKSVAGGKEYFSPSLSAYLLNRSRRPAQAPEESSVYDLTPTERRVLFLIADLRTTKEIATELGVSPRTVDNHRAHICAKLNLSGSHALTKFALDYKRTTPRV
jgi:DNA-binding NarL/FixJ family response regulator